MQNKRRLELIEQECQIRNDLNKIQFTHYFTNQFMEKNTQFFCIEEFLESVGVTSQSSLERLPISSWESHVQESTIFASWQEMLDSAGQEYALNNLY